MKAYQREKIEIKKLREIFKVCFTSYRLLAYNVCKYTCKQMSMWAKG